MNVAAQGATGPPIFDFRGQHVVVTGASSGLGLACTRAFASSGARVTLIGRRIEPLQKAARELQQAGGDVEACACDVTDDGALEKSRDVLAQCDVLVNNAGSNVPQPFFDVQSATLDHLLALNVRAVYRVAQLAARGMVERGRGVIVNMSSQMGHVGARNRTVYCMTKHAVEGFTKALAVELAPHGVRVLAIAPTYISTALTEPFLADPEFRQGVVSAIPLGRVGTAGEVAAAVLFAASSHASLITGSSILVDGGYTAI